MPTAEVVPIGAMATPTKKPTKFTEELGVTLDMPFGAWNDEVFNPAEANVPDLLPRLDAMQRNDGHARALYRLLSLPFRRCTWDVTPADGGDEEADFIKQIFTRPPYEGGMTTSFDYIRACGSKAMVNGFQVWEKVWDYQEVPGHGERFVLSKLAPRAAKTIRFRADENGGFDGVVQRAYAPIVGYKQVVIPKEKCFFYAVDKEEHPFYGRSMFEPALYHYDKKHKLYYLAHIAAQMGAVPGRLAYEDDSDLSDPQKIALRTAIANFGFNTAMMVPRGIRIEPFGNEHSIGSDILGLVSHHNTEMSQSILGQFIDLGQGEKAVGSYALSSDSSDLFIMCEETLVNGFFEHLSWYVIPQLIDLNFGSKKYPTITPDPLADDMKAALMEIFSALSVAPQQNVTADFIFELEKKVAEQLGLDIDYDAIEEQREEEQKQQQTVVDALGKLMGDGLGEGDTAPPMPELPDAANPAKPGAVGPGGKKPTPAGPPKPFGLAEITLAEKRDKLGQFARINELGSGAGMSAKAKGNPTGKDQEALGPVVGDIQKMLAGAGYSLGPEGSNELFGPDTAAAVKQFQLDNGLPGTGRVDLGTYALLLESTGKSTKSKGGDDDKKPQGPPKDVHEAAARLRKNKKAIGKQTPTEED